MQNFDNNELQKRVSEVLYYQWDPIGVAQAPEARGEYEGYVLQVLAILQRSNDPNELALFLSKLRCNDMWLPPNAQNDLNAAELLHGHKQAIIDGLA